MLLIETNVCKSNKKAKKRFNKIKNLDEFYIKHVWQSPNNQASETAFLTQLESILKAVSEQEAKMLTKPKDQLAEERDNDSDDFSDSD